MVRWFLVAAVLLGCTDPQTASLVGTWTPDDQQVVTLAGDRGVGERAHLARVGQRSVEFDADGTLIHVAGPVTRTAKWRVTDKTPLRIETRTEIGDGELVDAYAVEFPSPATLHLVEAGGHRSVFTRAR